MNYMPFDVGWICRSFGIDDATSILNLCRKKNILDVRRQSIGSR